MIKRQTKGKIFLAEERGVSDLDWFQSSTTFNFGNYYNEHKQPFGNLSVLNDDVLAEGHSVKMITEKNFYVILFPIMGAISYGDMAGNKNLVAAGQVQLTQVKNPITYQITNPFFDGSVNFLQLWIKADKSISPDPPLILSYKDVNKNINQLVNVFLVNEQTLDLPFSISIGKFSGRGETTHQLKKNNLKVFLFVLVGVFEVEGRLLHPRDGLALQEVNEIEIEALSNDAIMLLVEMK